MASIVQSAIGANITNLSGNQTLALTNSTPAGNGIICIVPTWGDYSAQAWVLTVSGEPTAGNADRMTEVGAPFYDATRTHGFRAYIYPAVVNAGVKTITLAAAGATGMHGSLNLLEVTAHNPAALFVREATLAGAVRANASLNIDANINDIIVGAYEGTTNPTVGTGYTAWDFNQQDLFDFGQYRVAPSTGTHAVPFVNSSGTNIVKAWVFANNLAGTDHALTGAAAAAATAAGNLSALDPRYARPSADVSAGGWVPSTGGDLFAMLDEASAIDTDYMSAASATTCEIRLRGVVNPGGSSGRVVRFRSPAGYTPSGGVVVSLQQGATEIAAWAVTPVEANTTYERSLDAGQVAAITNYEDLRLRFEAVVN